MGPKLRLVRLQHFTFITLLSVFSSAFPSHKVHLIYLEHNSDLQSFPVLLLTYDLCGCFRCDFTAQRVRPREGHSRPWPDSSCWQRWQVGPGVCGIERLLLLHIHATSSLPAAVCLNRLLF